MEVYTFMYNKVNNLFNLKWNKVGIPLVIVVLVVANEVSAQNFSFYYPHYSGDFWEYLVCSEVWECDTLQVRVIYDSTAQNGLQYFIREAYTINPIGPPFLFWATTYFILDTLNQLSWSNSGYPNPNWISIKLDAQLGDRWTIGGDSGVWHVEVTDVIPGYLFGQASTYKTYGYSVGVTELIQMYAIKLADGFGEIWMGGGDAAGEYYLRGAVINGILYGDTTYLGGSFESNLVGNADTFTLQNHPNPFNSYTLIKIYSHQQVEISIRILDICGRQVRDYGENVVSGTYECTWDGKNSRGALLSSGVYLLHLQSGKNVITRKMCLIR